jgi:hypothetical protein
MISQVTVPGVVIVQFGVCWHHIIIQYSDLSTIPGALFANRLACGNMEEAVIMLHNNSCTLWQSCVKR